MFSLIRQFVQLQDDTETATAPVQSSEPDHYLYFRGIPMPPDDYIAPAGASPNTYRDASSASLCSYACCRWPAIYNNLQNIDYCTTTFSHLGNRKFCRCCDGGRGKGGGGMKGGSYVLGMMRKRRRGELARRERASEGGSGGRRGRGERRGEEENLKWLWMALAKADCWTFSGSALCLILSCRHQVHEVLHPEPDASLDAAPVVGMTALYIVPNVLVKFGWC